MVATPGVPNWTYPNSTLPEPGIGLTSGTVTSISGYSDLGGADSAVTLGLWETAAEPGHEQARQRNRRHAVPRDRPHARLDPRRTLLRHAAGSYVPTFEANCKPNYQSVMNYLFQLDGVGPNAAVAFSNQTLTTLLRASLALGVSSADLDRRSTTISRHSQLRPGTTSTAPSPTASPATLHCDGTPLDRRYRISREWHRRSHLSAVVERPEHYLRWPVSYSPMRGYNDLANIDLRQVGATGGEFASLASVLSFGSSATPLNVAAGGNVDTGRRWHRGPGRGGTVTLGCGGNATLEQRRHDHARQRRHRDARQRRHRHAGQRRHRHARCRRHRQHWARGGNCHSGQRRNHRTRQRRQCNSWQRRNRHARRRRHHHAHRRRLHVDDSLHAVATIHACTQLAAGPSHSAAGGTIALGSGGNVTLGSWWNHRARQRRQRGARRGGNVTLGGGGTIALGSGGTVTLGSWWQRHPWRGGTVALGSWWQRNSGSGGNVTLGSRRNRHAGRWRQCHAWARRQRYTRRWRNVTLAAAVTSRSAAAER